MTSNQAAAVRSIAASPEYSDLLHFRGAERALNYLASGFEDVKTGEKQPWVAARATKYLRSNPLWPQMSTTLATSDKALLEGLALEGVRPGEKFGDSDYLNQLAAVAAKFIGQGGARATLPRDLVLLIEKYDQLDLDVLQTAAMVTLVGGGDPAAMAICLRQDSSCVSRSWFERSAAELKQWEVGQYAVGESALREGFLSICETSN